MSQTNFLKRINNFFLDLKFHAKLTAASTVVVIAIIFMTTYINYKAATEKLFFEFGQKLMSVVATGAIEIDGDKFDSLRRPEQMNSDEYKAIHSYLVSLKSINKHINIKFIYTMRPAAKDKKWEYVIDAESKNSKDFSKLGDTDDYPRLSDNYETVLRAPSMYDEINQFDRWGELLTATAPIKNKKGETVGLLCIDVSGESVKNELSKVRTVFYIILAAGLMLSFLLSHLFSRTLTRPFANFKSFTAKIAAGDFNAGMKVETNDEIGDLATAFNNMRSGLKEREFYKKQFERYVSPQVAALILASPEKVFWEGEKKRVTVLFASIRGIDELSQKTSPEELIGFLNGYLSLTSSLILNNKGMIDKFIGDKIMALFGAPISFGSDEEMAVTTSVLMKEQLHVYLSSFNEKYGTKLKVSIGINTGEVVIGNVGSEKRLEYTAIGDTVNTAARIEELNKKYDTSILVSEAVIEKLKDFFRTRSVDAVKIRGKTTETRIFEILDRNK